MRVLATNGLERDGLDLLQQNGCEVDVRNGCSEKELSRIIGEYDALIVRTATKITAGVLRKRGKLKIICCATAGVNNIDVAAATENDIVVMNVPGGNANAVAEFALGLMLAAARNIIEADYSLKRRRWIKNSAKGEELSGKTLGIIGLGRIGGLLAQKAKMLGMQTLATDPLVEKSDYAEMLSLEELLARSDFISLHATLSDDNKNLISDREISMMKQGVYLINCSRAELMDDEALKRGVLSRGIKLITDVYRQEPKTDGALGQSDCELARLTRISTPHIAGSTYESRAHLALKSARQVISALKDGVWENTINLPPVSENLKPYVHIARVLGEFVAKLWFVDEPKRFDTIRFDYSRELANYDTQILAQSSLQGLISAFSSDGPVGLVNAHTFAEKRGFRISRTTHEDQLEYSNLVAVEIAGRREEKHRIEGIVVGTAKIRIVRIDDYPISIEPAGNLLLFENQDVIGVIHSVTGILKENDINIIDISHKASTAEDGTAMGIVGVSKVPNRKVLSDIMRLETIKFVKLLRF